MTFPLAAPVATGLAGPTLSNPPTPNEALFLLNKLYQELDARRYGKASLTSVAEEIGALKLNDYFLGKHSVAEMASAEWKAFAADRYGKFADNWCGPVGVAGPERTGVIGFKLPEEYKDAETGLWEEWKRSEMDSRSSQAFQAAVVQRRAFVSVWGELDGPDAGAPIIATESAEQAIVAYDSETRSRRLAGLKVWTDDDGEHATLYLPGWVIPYERIAGTQLTRPSGLVLTDREAGEWKVTRNEGQPIENHLGKVPLVELPNRPVLGGAPVSDIQGVAALQDSVNLLWLYLFNAADYASLPARVVMGQEPPKIPLLDEKGEKVGEVPVDAEALRKGRMLWLTGQSTTIGQWSPANLDAFTAVIEQVVGHIAAQTRTPPHYLVANKGLHNLSGDALKAAETGLVMKVRQAQEYLEPRLRDTFELIALQKGDQKLAEACRLGLVRWKDAENRSDAQQSDAMLKDVQAGYPFEWLLQRRGHSPEEIDQIMAMKAKEQQNAILAGVQGALRLPPAPGQPNTPPPADQGATPQPVNAGP